MDELSEEDVSKMLFRGIYHAKPGRNSPHAGRYYRIIKDIYDNDHKKVQHFYQCMKCQSVIKCNPSHGTKPLNSHADKCDPPQPKRK